MDSAFAPFTHRHHRTRLTAAALPGRPPSANVLRFGADGRIPREEIVTKSAPVYNERMSERRWKVPGARVRKAIGCG